MVRRFFSQALLFYKGRTAAFSLVEFLCFDTFYPLVTMAFYCLLAAHSFRTTDLTTTGGCDPFWPRRAASSR